MTRFVISADRMITPLEDIRGGSIVVSGEMIEQVVRSVNLDSPDLLVHHFAGCTAVPGFVDIHHHGALGKWASEGDAAVDAIAQYLPETGTTSWFPTVRTLEAVASARRASRIAGRRGADIPGIHMEGPFLGRKDIPGENEGLMDPSLRLVDEALECAQGMLKIMGLAPDLPGAMEVIRHLRANNVVPALAHSRTDYATFVRSVEAGIRHITHIYNEMSGLHHRKPGVLGGVLDCDQVTGELIADGYHVHPAAMRILLRCKGVDRVALITDNTPLAGMPDGDYGRVTKRSGVVRIKGYGEDVDGTLAGSVWPMHQGVKNLVDLCGLTLRDAIRMATLTPSNITGLEKTKGSLEPKKHADITILDKDLNVRACIVKGRLVYGSLPGRPD